MRPKSMVLILIALFCGLIASIGISQVVERQGKDNSPKLKTVKIFVASTDVEMSDELTAQNVRMEDWPAGKVPEGAVKDLEQLMGRRPRLRLFAGDPITNKKLHDANYGGSGAEQIPKGYRVMSVKVSMDTAVSNLIKPGDRVDVLVFHKRSGGRSRTSTLMRNVTVFAVNSKVSRETDEDGKPIAAKTISMLVKPGEVEKLAHAEETGRIRLSLRRPDEDANEDEETDGFSMDDQPVIAATIPTPSLPSPFTAFSTPVQPSGPAFEMQVISGNSVKNFTWNDVTELPNELQAKQQAAASSASGLPTPVNLNLPSDTNQLEVPTSSGEDTDSLPPQSTPPAELDDDGGFTREPVTENSDL